MSSNIKHTKIRSSYAFRNLPLSTEEEKISITILQLIRDHEYPELYMFFLSQKDRPINDELACFINNSIIIMECCSWSNIYFLEQIIRIMPSKMLKLVSNEIQWIGDVDVKEYTHDDKVLLSELGKVLHSCSESDYFSHVVQQSLHKRIMQERLRDELYDLSDIFMRSQDLEGALTEFLESSLFKEMKGGPEFRRIAQRKKLKIQNIRLTAEKDEMNKINVRLLAFNDPYSRLKSWDCIKILYALTSISINLGSSIALLLLFYPTWFKHVDINDLFRTSIVLLVGLEMIKRFLYEASALSHTIEISQTSNRILISVISSAFLFEIGRSQSENEDLYNLFGLWHVNLVIILSAISGLISVYFQKSFYQILVMISFAFRYIAEIDVDFKFYGEAYLILLSILYAAIARAIRSQLNQVDETYTAILLTGSSEWILISEMDLSIRDLIMRIRDKHKINTKNALSKVK